MVKVITAGKPVHPDREATAHNRELLREKGVVLVNLVGPPGVGKTSLLEKVLPSLMNAMMVGVIVVDPFAAQDAERLQKAGVRVVQVNTEDGAYLDAAALKEALAEFPLDALDLILLENVGGAVLPADYDLGENVKIALTSVTGGMDKTTKYPWLFKGAYATVITKIDLLDDKGFSLGGFIEKLFAINRSMRVFALSAAADEGVEEWTQFLSKLVWGNRRSIRV